MSVPAPTRVGMPMDEFIRLYDEAPFELIDGERIALVPSVAEPGEALKILYGALLVYEMTQKKIAVYSELPFVLSDTSDWVKGSRVPDAMVYEASRMAAYKAQTPNWKKKPYVLVPDLCVEVISPTDNFIEVIAKVERYLVDGVRVVWLVNPSQRTVTIFRVDSNQTIRLSENDALEYVDILPDFSIHVRDIFA